MATVTTQLARLSVLQLELPGNAPLNAGVLLEDPANNRLHLRLRRDWDVIAPSEATVLSELESDLAAKAQDLGAARVLDQLQDTLSNMLTISSPREVMVEDFERAVLRLYREMVQATVRPFVTHLPRSIQHRPCLSLASWGGPWSRAFPTAACACSARA
jgi:hypothetical protein